MGGMRFERDREFTVRWGSLGGTSGQFADMDNDGDLDLVIGDAQRRDGTRGPVLLVNDWPNNRFLDAAELDRGNLLAAISTAGDASCVVADFNADGKCDVLLAVMGQAPVIVRTPRREETTWRSIWWERSPRRRHPTSVRRVRPSGRAWR